MNNRSKDEIDRRQFFRRATFALAGVAVLPVGTGCLFGCTKQNDASVLAQSKPNETDKVSSSIRLVSPDEPGERLIVAGTIYGADSKMPLAGIKLYVYHTDAKGIYSTQDTGASNRNPRLKGTLITDRDGRYEFRTIKPASYPGSSIPAHIHASASGAGYKEQGIHEFWFEDDPYLTAGVRARFAGQNSFSPIMPIKRGADGVLRCVHDIKLERN